MNKTKLPKGWCRSRIGDVVDLYIDNGLPEDVREFTYIDISAIDNRAKEILHPRKLYAIEAPSRARQQVKQGDVLVSTTRPNLNAVALVPPKLNGAIASTGFAVLRPVLFESRWMFAVVQSEEFVSQMSALVKGALYPAIRPTHVHDYVMPVPPLPEQKKITTRLTNLLNRLRNISETLAALPSLLQQYRAAVLEAACTGRLVPTEAELCKKQRCSFETASMLLDRFQKERRSNWESLQITKMLAAGKAIKSDKWKERYQQPVAPISTHNLTLPKGWAWASIAQCSSVVQYGTSAKTNEDRDGVPVIRMGNIAEGELKLGALRFLPKSHVEFPELLLEKGDVLFNRTNSAELVGKTAVFKEKTPHSYASYLIRLRLLEGCIPEYVTHFINSTYGRIWISSVAGQMTGQANVSGAKLAALAIPLPPTAEQKRIVAEVERRLSALSTIELQLSEASEETDDLRASLFQLAVSGKLVPRMRRGEKATELLSRIQKFKDRQATQPKIRSSRGRGSKHPPNTMLTLEDIKSDHLAKILRKHDSPLEVRALWKESQLTVDDFYAQLKKELNKSVKEVGPNRKLEANV